MEEYRFQQKAPSIQELLNKVPTLEQGLQDETSRAQAAEGELLTEIGQSVGVEASRAQGIEADLQAQINEIVGGGATVGLTATSQQTSSSVVFAREQNTINLKATASTNATSITITGGSLSQPLTGSGKTLQGTDTITPAQAGTTTYNAAFVIAGQPRTATATITAVYPIYYGAGMAQSDVLDVAACKASARTTPKGTYTVTVSGSAKYIWFFIPANMTQITSAKMNGFDFPLQTLADVTDANGITYKVYRTPNTQEVGTYPISINQ